MTDLLQRYQSGQHVEVWDELLAYGTQVREEPLLSEALAVARETMRRVRHNVEALIPRLRMIGYQFGYGWVQPYMDLPAFYQAGKRLEELEAEHLTYEARLAYSEFLEQASKEPPLFVSANHNEEHIRFLDGLINESQNEYRLKELRTERERYQSLPSAVDQVQQLEAITGPLPLSVRVWYEEVGGVNFVGTHPDWYELVVSQLKSSRYAYGYQDLFEQKGRFGQETYLYPLYVLDPFCVYPLRKMVEESREEASKGRTEQFLEISLDDMGKYFEIPRGYYTVKVPSLEADVVVAKSGVTFVQYLRTVMRWGGFPGWETLVRRPEQDLAFLTKDLLPF